MRYCLFFFLFLIANAGIQRGQISQAYNFELTSQDCKLTQQENKVILNITSEKLEKFLNSPTPTGQFDTQSVMLNGGYTEFTTNDKNFYNYSNSQHSSLKPDLNKVIFELEKIDDKTYEVKHMLKPIENIQQCQIIMQKNLTSLIEGKRDFVINLDNQYYFDKLVATQKFLQCLR